MEEAGTGCSVLVLLMLSLSPLVLCGVCAGVTLCHKQLKQRRSGMNIDVANLNDFELGDDGVQEGSVVRLRQGGRRGTVTRVFYDGDVEVRWEDDGSTSGWMKVGLLEEY